MKKLFWQIGIFETVSSITQEINYLNAIEFRDNLELEIELWEIPWIFWKMIKKCWGKEKKNLWIAIRKVGWSILDSS